MEPQPTAEQKRAQLRHAVRCLRERGLYQSAKWAAEVAVGLMDGGPSARGETVAAVSTSSAVLTDADEPEEELYLLAKSYFDLKEYRRAAHFLRDVAGNKARFLRCFALYLAGEKRRAEEAVELTAMTTGRVGGAAGPGSAVATAAAAGHAAGVQVGGSSVGRADTVNPELLTLDEELAAAYDAGELDPFCKYLYGVVLIDREGKSAVHHTQDTVAPSVLAVRARTVLCECLREFPWHWGAWQALMGLCLDSASADSLDVPHDWVWELYRAAQDLELQRNQEGLTRYQALAATAPNSAYLKAQQALALYNLREFEGATSLYAHVLAHDPHRVESMDVYSNVLYCQEKVVELSHLAHRIAQTDKYRPETCCVIGNYYSLKGHHEKAMQYFNRALKLDRHYLSAWTLMGHEYVEIKNVPMAIDAYRRGVDINPLDYRAWYGLGQTYEILQMPHYALYYFQRAAQIKPADARMWVAMAQCYTHEHLAMDAMGVRCYQRAIQNGDKEFVALPNLAKLYAKMGLEDQAAKSYLELIEHLERESKHDDSKEAEALLYLGNHCKEIGDFEKAEQYCTRLLDFGGPAKEEAKALLREIRSVQQSAVVAPSPCAMVMSPGSPLGSP